MTKAQFPLPELTAYHYQATVSAYYEPGMSCSLCY